MIREYEMVAEERKIRKVLDFLKSLELTWEVNHPFALACRLLTLEVGHGEYYLRDEELIMK